MNESSSQNKENLNDYNRNIPDNISKAQYDSKDISREFKDGSLCSFQKKSFDKSKNVLNSGIDKISEIEDISGSLNNFLSQGSTMKSNCVKSEEKKYISELVQQFSTRPDEQSLHPTMNQAQNNFSSLSTFSTHNHISQKECWKIPKKPVTTGIKLSVNNAFKFVTKKQQDEIPFMIKIQDLDKKNAKSENLENNDTTPTRQGGIDIILVIGFNYMNGCCDSIRQIVDSILKKAKFDVDRVALCKFYQINGNEQERFMISSFTFINDDSIRMVLELLKKPKEKWNIVSKNFKDIITNSQILLKNAINGKNQGRICNIVLLANVITKTNQLETIFSDLSYQEYVKLQAVLQKLKEVQSEMGPYPILNLCIIGSQKLQIYPNTLKLCYNSGGVVFFCNKPKDTNKIKQLICERLYKIQLYNISFIQRINKDYELSQIRTYNNVNLTYSKSKGFYRLKIANLHQGQRSVYLLKLSEKPLEDRNKNCIKENTIDWVGGTGQAHFLSMESSSHVVQSSKEFDINCRVLSPKLEEIMTSQYCKQKVEKCSKIEHKLDSNQNIQADDNVTLKSESALTQIVDENDQYQNKDGTPLLSDSGNFIFHTEKETRAAKDANLYSEQNVETFRHSINKNFSNTNTDVQKSTPKDIEILDINSNFFCEIIYAKLLYYMQHELTKNKHFKEHVKDIQSEDNWYDFKFLESSIEKYFKVLKPEHKLNQKYEIFQKEYQKVMAKPLLNNLDYNKLYQKFLSYLYKIKNAY